MFKYSKLFMLASVPLVIVVRLFPFKCKALNLDAVLHGDS